MLVRTRVRRLAATATIVALAVGGLSMSRALAQNKLAVSIAVPAYFNDDDSWDRAINTSVVTYIVGHPDTPANGKFVAAKELTTHLAQAKAKGKTTLIYVTAGYDKIGWEEVANRIDSAFDAYPNADGVFIDEINYDQCAKYKSLSAGSGSIKGVRDRHPGKQIVLNPGAPMLNCYQGLADGYLNLERADKDVQAWTDNVNLPGNTPYYAWMFKPDIRAQIWQMVHSVPSGDVDKAVDAAVARNASVLYVTPDVLPNPYDKLPDDGVWNKIIDRVQQYATGKVQLPAVKQLVIPANAATTTIKASADTAATPTTRKPTATTKKATTKTTTKTTKKR